MDSSSTVPSGAPDGTAYVSIDKVDAAGDDYVTTVRVLSSVVVV